MPAACAAPSPRACRGEDRQDLRAVRASVLPARPPSVCPSTNSMATNTRSSNGARVVDHHHVRVRELRNRLRLAQQPGGHAASRAFPSSVQELEGDLAIQLADRTHANTSPIPPRPTWSRTTYRPMDVPRTMPAAAPTSCDRPPCRAPSATARISLQAGQVRAWASTVRTPSGSRHPSTNARMTSSSRQAGITFVAVSSVAQVQRRSSDGCVRS